MEKVGFAAFFHTCRVPGVIFPAYRCGWQKKDPKHLIIFCPDQAHHHCRLYEAAKTNQYKRMMSTGKRLRAVARWVMSKSLLSQFSLAKEQSDWVESKKKEAIAKTRVKIRAKIRAKMRTKVLTTATTIKTQSKNKTKLLV